ncbi:MAG: regulatory protein GemA [Nitrospirota bacterium]
MQKPIDKRQIRKIHTLKSALKLSDDEYREKVQEIHGFSGTSKDLTYDEAETLIRAMESEALSKGVWQRRVSRKSKYEYLGDREGMATPKQLRMIEAIWKDVSRYHAEDERARALRSFLFKRFKVSDVKFITSRQASKIIWSLFNMSREGKQQ